MTVLVEFSIATDRFALGEQIARHEDLTAELERIVPTDTHVIPYVWVTGPTKSIDALTGTLEQSDAIASVRALDRVTVGDSEQQQQLYRIDWHLDELDVVTGIVEAGGVILEGESTDDNWTFRFRFPDHEHVAQFYQYLTDHEITKFTIESVSRLESHPRKRQRYDLTAAQREALTLAAREGYFSTPREVTLTELADDLDISEQALSQRIRHATEKVVLVAVDDLGAPTT